MPDRSRNIELQILKIDIAPAKRKQFADPKSDHTQLKTERWTASVTYVFRENVKNTELAVNPLGLTIIRFRVDQAFN